MEAPKDYILEMIRTSLDEKIDSMGETLKCDIASLRTEIKDFHNLCRSDMQSHEKRIRSNEEFKIQVIAISGAVGTISALIFSLLLKFLGS